MIQIKYWIADPVKDPCEKNCVTLEDLARDTTYSLTQIILCTLLIYDGNFVKQN